MNPNLFLGKVSMQLVTFHTQDTEYDAHLVGQFFAAQENYDIRLESPLAQCDKQCGSLGFLSSADSNELLYKTASGTTLRVHKKPHRLVQRHFNQLVHRVRHGGGKQHSLARSGTRLDDFSQFICETIGEHPVSFIQDQDVESIQREGGRVVNVVDESTRSRDHDVRTTTQSNFLGLDRQATWRRRFNAEVGNKIRQTDRL